MYLYDPFQANSNITYCIGNVLHLVLDLFSDSVAANDVTAPVEIAVNKAGVVVEVDVCDNAEKSRDESDKGTDAQAVQNDATTDTTNDTTEKGVTKVGQH